MNDATARADVVHLEVGLIAKAFTFLPLFAAKRRGFFGSHAIDCEYTVVGAPDPVTDGLKSGRFQFSPTTPEGTMADRASGGSLVVVAGWTNSLPFKLIGLKQHTNLESLRGGTIGVSSLTEGTVHVIQTMLAHAGLRYPDDYTLKVVGAHPQRWQLLQDGKIDAGLQPTPYDHMALEAGFSDLGDPSDWFPEFAFSVVAVESKWAEANAKIVVRLLRALLDATAWVHDHPDKAAQVLVEETGTTPRLAQLSVRDLLAGDVMPRDLHVSRTGLELVLRIMRDTGRLTGGASLDPDSYIDDRYLRSALT
jgi:NitT/TauT family transport system substrate-binding protein